MTPSRNSGRMREADCGAGLSRSREPGPGDPRHILDDHSGRRT